MKDAFFKNHSFYRNIFGAHDTFFSLGVNLSGIYRKDL